MRLPTKPATGVQRTGSIHTLLIFVTILILGLLGMALGHARLWTIRVELQNSGDAAVLAAAEVLVDDDLLRGTLCANPGGIPSLLELARLEANLYAGRNPVNGREFQLDPNLDNEANGDIVFGNLDQPRGKTFVLAENVNDPSNISLADINTIRINARLLQSRGNAPGLLFPQFTGQSYHNVVARSSAMLDCDVIGFRHIVEKPIPLAPLALLADYGQTDARSWNKQIEAKSGTDEYVLDPSTKQFTQDPSGDGLPEFAAVLPLEDGHKVDANVSLLFLGAGKSDPDRFKVLNNQLVSGITQADLADLGGEFVLDANNQLRVPGSELGSSNSSDVDDLRNALLVLKAAGEVRIWPLYCGFQDGDPVVCGFVAARVAEVEPLSSGEPLRFTLQPTMIASSAAVTDVTRRGVNGVPIVNLYICKVRMVE
jgi:hypothetical protein